VGRREGRRDGGGVVDVDVAVLVLVGPPPGIGGSGNEGRGFVVVGIIIVGVVVAVAMGRALSEMEAGEIESVERVCGPGEGRVGGDSCQGLPRRGASAWS
jgi:hypothetical protein